MLSVLAAASSAHTQDGHEHHHHDAPQAADAQIVVTINPEVRIKAELGAPPPPPGPCGSPVEYKVRIINQGFLTAPLRAEIIDDGARLAALHMDEKKLSGGPDDMRLLHLIPFGPGLADLTIVFSIDENIGDHSGKDRVHVLLDCLR